MYLYAVKHLFFISLIFSAFHLNAQIYTVPEESQDSIFETFYDTILVYDTIYVEEIVYDTVVVYDTIYVEQEVAVTEWRTQQNFKWYAGVYLKPEYAFPNHTGTIEYYDYIERVEASEQPLLNPDFGVSLGRKIGRKYFATLGVEYTSLRKRIDYKFTDSLITLTDTVLSNETFYNTNNLHFVDMPVTFGRMFMHEKCNLELAGGLSTRMFLSTTGKTLSPESYNEVIPLDELAWRRFSFSFVAEAALTKVLTTHVDVLAKAFLKYDISNIYAVHSKFEQRPHYVGLKFGFRYHF